MMKIFTFYALLWVLSIHRYNERIRDHFILIARITMRCYPVIKPLVYTYNCKLKIVILNSRLSYKVVAKENTNISFKTSCIKYTLIILLLYADNIIVQ